MESRCGARSTIERSHPRTDRKAESSQVTSRGESGDEQETSRGRAGDEQVTSSNVLKRSVYRISLFRGAKNQAPKIIIYKVDGLGFPLHSRAPDRGTPALGLTRTGCLRGLPGTSGTAVRRASGVAAGQLATLSLVCPCPLQHTPPSSARRALGPQGYVRNPN